MKHFDRTHYKDPEEYQQSIKDKGCSGFCPIPWVSLGVNNNGDYRMCVQAAANRKDNIRGQCKGTDGVTMRIEDTSIADSRNSEVMKETRRDMIAGKRSEHCVRCNKEDDAGSSSRRWLDLKKYWQEFDIDDAIENTNEDGSIDTEEYPLLDLDLRLDNTCNLKCRMCGPTESHQWYTEWVKTSGYNKFKAYDHTVNLEMKGNRAQIVGKSPYGWSDRVDVANILQKDAPHLKQIYMSGGEPLIIKQQYELLQKYIDNGTAKDLEVDYNTNFTSIPQRALDQWKEFKQVNIGGSVDGIDKVNDYVRYPSKWSQVKDNIKKLDTQTEDNVTCWLTYTWQILNVLSVTDLIEYCLEQDFVKFNRYSQSAFFTYHPVHNPAYYCVTSLPDSAKEYVTNHINNWKNGWFTDWCNSKPKDYKMSNTNYRMRHHGQIIRDWDHGIDGLYDVTEKQLDSMLNFMHGSSTTEHMPEMWRRTQILDKSRGENFEEVYPELAVHIKKHLGISND
jgi:sulfatase maturation enzyme AslB (radical SAM superfamily)